MHKINIYQVFTRLFQQNGGNTFYGSIQDNGSGKFNNFNSVVLEEIKNLNIDHIWYTGIIRHATTTAYPPEGLVANHPATVKGRAGSPYAITDYYDVNPDLAVNVARRMEEFHELVARTNLAGMGVIIDFVPNHVAREYGKGTQHSQTVLGANDNDTEKFSTTNNFYYLEESLEPPKRALQTPYAQDETQPFIETPAKATGNDCFSHQPSENDWYETVKLNYGIDYQNGQTQHFDPIPATWFQMIDILRYWAAKGIAGFRCDMVEMVPVAFWSLAIKELKKDFPGLFFIAEIYNEQNYLPYIEQAGFDYLYDKVGLYDSLRAIICGHKPANDLSLLQTKNVVGEHHLLRFLENHDEQRLASSFFAGNPSAGLPAFAVCVLMHNGPAMLYFGQELGEASEESSGFSGTDGRSTIFDYWQLKSIGHWLNHSNEAHTLPTNLQKIRLAYQNILGLCKRKVFAVGNFIDIQSEALNERTFNEQHLFAFARKELAESCLVIVNFNGQVSHLPQIKLPVTLFDSSVFHKKDRAQLFDLYKGNDLGTHDIEKLKSNGLSIVLKPYDLAVISIKPA